VLHIAKSINGPASVTRGNIVVRGTVEAIRRYEMRNSTSIDATATPTAYLNAYEIATHLDIAADDMYTVPVEFKGFVARELVGRRVTYRETSESIDGKLGNDTARQYTVIQDLIPDDDGYPSYKAINVRFEKRRSANVRKLDPPAPPLTGHKDKRAEAS
jgi:hypothetical protein